MSQEQRVIFRIITDGHMYRVPRMNAFDQMWVFKSIEPLFRGMAASVRNKPSAGGVDADLILNEFASMTDENLDGVISRALRNAERFGDGGEWLEVWDQEADQLLEGALSLQDLLQACAMIIWQNLRPFLTRDPFEFDRMGKRPPSFDAVTLPDGLSWLLTPVQRGMCRYESLLDGTLTLNDVALMNDFLMAEGENESRAYKAAEENRDNR